MLTPYQFASNTPIQADDIDGLEARKRVIPNEDGSTVIKITVDFKLINSSSSKVDYKRLKEEVAKQIAKDYKVSNKDANVSYEVEAVNITVVGESNVDRSKDFFIELKDKGTLTIRGKAYKGLFGFTDKMGDTESNRFQIAVTSLRDMAHTIVHELGHGSGMKHVGSEEEQRMDKLGNDGQYDPDYNTKTSPHNIMKEGKTLKSNDETVEPLQMKTATDNMHESDPKSTETIK